MVTLATLPSAQGPYEANNYPNTQGKHKTLLSAENYLSNGSCVLDHGNNQKAKRPYKHPEYRHVHVLSSAGKPQ